MKPSLRGLKRDGRAAPLVGYSLVAPAIVSGLSEIGIGTENEMNAVLAGMN